MKNVTASNLAAKLETLKKNRWSPILRDGEVFTIGGCPVAFDTGVVYAQFVAMTYVVGNIEDVTVLEAEFKAADLLEALHDTIDDTITMRDLRFCPLGDFASSDFYEDFLFENLQKQKDAAAEWLPLPTEVAAYVL